MVAEIFGAHGPLYPGEARRIRRHRASGVGPGQPRIGPADCGGRGKFRRHIPHAGERAEVFRGHLERLLESADVPAAFARESDRAYPQPLLLLMLGTSSPNVEFVLRVTLSAAPVISFCGNVVGFGPSAGTRQQYN